MNENKCILGKSDLKRIRERIFSSLGSGMAAIAFVLVGCRGVQTSGEREAREQVRSVHAQYNPEARPKNLPELKEGSSLEEHLRYAILNQPQVEAAYYDWVASAERITRERSLPDPRLTFEMYLQRTITSLMPGLMMDFPGPGKLPARARVAAAESDAKYFAFETSILQAAFALKESVFKLHFLDERIQVNRQTLSLLSELEKLARAQNEVGKVTLQDVLRAQIERGRVQTDIANLEDSRVSLVAQFKAALGLKGQQFAPPLPKFEPSSTKLDSEQLFDLALKQNPKLKVMAAEVKRAEASLALARKSKVPDFSAGFEADVKPSPVIWNPQFSVTLPIWRDKIAAEIAEAQAGKSAAQARLSAEQIALAVDFAQKSFMYREAARNLSLLQQELVPKQRQSLEVARSGYVAGQIDFFNLTDAEQTLLRFSLAEIEAQEQREIALAELSLMIAGVPPPGAPMREHHEQAMRR